MYSVFQNKHNGNFEKIGNLHLFRTTVTDLQIKKRKYYF